MSRRRVANPSVAAPKVLLSGIRALIEASRQRVASTVDAELTLLFWPSSLLASMGAALGRRSCAGCSSSPPRFPRSQLLRQLSWSHFVLLLALKEPLQRDYYAQLRGKSSIPAASAMSMPDEQEYMRAPDDAAYR